MLTLSPFNSARVESGGTLSHSRKCYIGIHYFEFEPHPQWSEEWAVPKMGKKNKNKNRRLDLFTHVLWKYPQIVHHNKTGYKYSTILPILPILNFSTILCTKYQPLEMISPKTMSFPAELHGVLGLQLIFFITWLFLLIFCSISSRPELIEASLC